MSLRGQSSDTTTPRAFLLEGRKAVLHCLFGTKARGGSATPPLRLGKELKLTRTSPAGQRYRTTRASPGTAGRGAAQEQY